MPLHSLHSNFSTYLADTEITPHTLSGLSRMPRHLPFHRPTVGLVAAMLLTFSAASFQVIAHENHASVSPEGRFTPNVDGAVFPPQPRAASNVRVHTPSTNTSSPVRIQGAGVRSLRSRAVLSSAGVTAESQAAQAALRSADVQALLGNRYSLIKVGRVRDKAARSKNVFRVEFFSLSENRTVIAKATNGVITNIKSYAASERQPPLGEAEKALAIKIAQQYWVDRGDPRIANLDGYAIQTFQPDGSPYVSRVAYVSFHTESPEPPELINWVDLSDERVFRAEIVR